MQRLLRRLVVVLVTATVGLTVGAAPGAPGAPGGRAGPTTTTAVADAGWDPAIRAIATQVERLRGLRFRTPVAVEFQDEATFVADMQRSTGRWVARQKARLERDLATLRALGLADADVDVAQAFSDTAANDVLAYYDPSLERIRIRGGLDARTAPIVAHELTHALQDQHFDLDALDRAARRTSQQLMVDTWLEGDADRVQRLFAATQPDRDQEAAAGLEAEATESLDQANSGADLPEIYTALEVAPYLLGEPAVTRLVDRDGVDGLDDMIATVPRSDRDAFDPVTAGGPSAPTVAAPALRRGERRTGTTDDLGAIGVYLLLASRLGPVAALDVVDGWAGDRMVTFTRDGTACARIAIATTGSGSRAAMINGLEAIARELPARSWSVDPRPGGVEVTACDPGAAAREAAPYAGAAITLLSVRNQGMVAALAEGARPPAARCVGTALTHDPVVAHLAITEALDDAELAEFWQRWHAAMAACGV